MKVYIVNVNNCEAYSDYWEGNRGVYSTYQQAVDAMSAQGFDPSTKIKLLPWYDDEKDWLENGWYDRNEYRIEEWEMDEPTCHRVDVNGYAFRFECSSCGYVAIVHNCGTMLDELPGYCPKCGARVIGE